MASILLDNSLHTGLGDLIVLSGMAREFSESFDEVYLMIDLRYCKDVLSLMLDNPKINFLARNVDPIPPVDKTILLGDRDPEFRKTGKTWSEIFYLQAGLPYEISYDYFTYPEPEDPWVFEEPYLIYHEDKARYFDINYKYLNSVERITFIPTGRYWDRPIASWIPALAKAKEIHVIDSVFMNLVDRIPTTGRLVLHRYARSESQDPFYFIPLRKDWEILT